MMNTHLLILFISNVTREAPKFWLPVYEWQLKFCNNHNIDWQLVLIVCVRVWTHLHNQTAKRGPERTLPALPLHHAAGCSPHETIDAVHHDIQVCSALKNKQNVKKNTHTQLFSLVADKTNSHRHTPFSLLVFAGGDSVEDPVASPPCASSCSFISSFFLSLSSSSSSSAGHR